MEELLQRLSELISDRLIGSWERLCANTVRCAAGEPQSRRYAVGEMHLHLHTTPANPLATPTPCNYPH